MTYIALFQISPFILHIIVNLG